jgi:hypothetical protein
MNETKTVTLGSTPRPCTKTSGMMPQILLPLQVCTYARAADAAATDTDDAAEQPSDEQTRIH